MRRTASAIRQSLAMLEVGDRRRLWFAILAQSLTALLDLAGVLLIAWVGLLAANLVQGDNQVQSSLDLEFPLLGNTSDVNQVLVISIFAAIILGLKSLISAGISRSVLNFLAGKQAGIASRLINGALGGNLSEVKSRPNEEIVYALTYGLNSATLVLLGHLIVVISDGVLLVLMGIALIVIEPLVTLGAIAFFTALAVGLHIVMGRWANRLGSARADVDQGTLRLISESIMSFRELSVLGRRGYMMNRIKALRRESAQIEADFQLLGLFPKYVLELGLVLGAASLTLFLLQTREPVAAIGILALFLATTTRIIPSLLRLQVSFLGIRSAASAAAPTFELDLRARSNACENVHPVQSTLAVLTSVEFDPTVIVESLFFRYPDSVHPALNNIDLQVSSGHTFAIVGSSGAGKSTLVDAILGIVEPISGSVKVGGMRPQEAIKLWPGEISYVPQNVFVADDSLRNNIALGIEPHKIDDQRVREVLNMADLGFLEDRVPEGLDQNLGDLGHRLSGGQRQRIGLARAFYSNPRLIVLDEATSALDSETEKLITETINSLRGEVTLIIIAHRLSTVRNVDQIAFMEGGTISARGTFKELKDSSPNFRRQAQNLGL